MSFELIKQEFILGDVELCVFKSNAKANKNSFDGTEGETPGFLLRESFRVFLNDQLREKNFGKLVSLKPGTPTQCSQGYLSVASFEDSYFVVFSKEKSLGLDVEDSDRLSSKIINRISDKKEEQVIEACGLDKAWLWSLKEAEFKRLSNSKRIEIDIMTQIKIIKMDLIQKNQVFSEYKLLSKVGVLKTSATCLLGVLSGRSMIAVTIGNR